MCVCTDTPDLRCLNINFAPLHNPFVKDFEIESYNTRWFDDEPDSYTPKPMHKVNDSISEEGDVEISMNLHPRPMSDTPAEKFSGELVASVDQVPGIVSGGKDGYGHLDSIVTSMETILESIQASKDKLFFVCYTPVDTLWP